MPSRACFPRTRRRPSVRPGRPAPRSPAPAAWLPAALWLAAAVVAAHAAATGEQATAADTLAADAAGARWLVLAPGLEWAGFTAGEVRIEVLRSDPRRWETVALAVSQVGGPPRAPGDWGRLFGLSAVINAGMFDVDRRTHTGYFRIDEHLNNPRLARRTHRQAACFEPRDEGLPPFRLVDLDAEGTDEPPAALLDRYRIVVQNLRLIRRPRENRWPVGTRPWAEACLGEDAQGRQLWIHCRRPLPMHDLVEILLDLPLDLVAAQHLEGGMQARLWLAADLAARALADDPDPDARTGRPVDAGWPVPNVLGLRPRLSDR